MRTAYFTRKLNVRISHNGEIIEFPKFQEVIVLEERGDQSIHGQNMQILDPCQRHAWLVTNVLGFCGGDEGEADDDKGSSTGETQ